MMDRNLSPLKIVIYYIVFGFLWIISSDVLVSQITKDPEILTKISIVKGWLFISVTAAFLYGLISLYSRQRTQSEISLRENEGKYRLLFESANDGIFIHDETGFIDCNQKGAEMYGLTKAEIIGRSPGEFAPKLQPDGRLSSEVAGEKIRAALNGVPQVFEWQPVRADGSPFDVEITLSRLELGGKMNVQAIVRDISERKRAAREIAEHGVMVQQIMDTASVGIGLVDKRGRITHANRCMAEMFGCAMEELIESEYADHVHPSERETSRLNMRALLASTIPSVNLERHYVRKDGTEFWGHLACRRFHDAQGNELGVIGVITDISERKHAEMELEKYRTQLEKLVEQRTKELSLLNDQLRQSQKLEAVGILAGGIAHEFSNILATMKGSVYLIQKKLPEDIPVMKYVRQVLASINKANILSQDLLTFSRKQKISLRPVHFNEIIGNVGKMLVQLIGEDIELAMMLSDKNPTVMADINQIEQVLVNLATNARDAMPDGGRLTIGTDVMKMDEEFKKQHGYGVPGEYVVLTISDNGAGIEDAIRGKIFEPFFTTKAVGKGSGLGLAVTYGIVKKHNGFIDVESVTGEGTTFRIYFPTVEAEVIQPIGRDRRLAAGGTETILLAEDDEDARATMSEMVRMIGYTVLEARDGEEAIKVFMENKDRIQLVFLDVRMPKKNGRVVYEEIRKIHPQTKFLFVSGYTADIIDSLGVSEGGINFISKAASPDAILRRIREVLDQ